MGEVSKTNNYTDFFYHAFRNILIIGIPLVIISALVLSLPHSSAEVSGGTDNVQLTLSTSCTVNAVVTEAHETSLHGGQKDDNVGNTKLSAFCNDNNGYSIYAVGSSNDIDGNTDLINTVNESYNIHTGVYNENNTSNPSSWAMKLTAGTGTGIDPVTGESVPTTPPTIINGFDNYSAIPNVYTQVAKRTSGTSMTTDTSVSGSYLNTTYQIYANSAQPAGTYNGKVKYVMIHPSNNNNHISFNEAYASQGRSPVNTESGTYYTMQDMDTSICSLVGIYDEASQTQLIDIRDNKLYWVAKLQDGHCWMTQNLSLDLGIKNSEFNIDTTILTSNDTDLTDHSINGVYKDGYSYDPSTDITTYLPSKTTINFSGTSIEWSNSYRGPSSANKTDNTGSGHSTLGNYYNWTAAIASNDSSSLLSNTYDSVADNPQNSICPRGWRLPVISSDIGRNEFAKLNNLYNNGSTINGFDLTIGPLWFTWPGMIVNGSYHNNNNGSYWSSTVFNKNGAYYFQISTNNVNPNGYSANNGDNRMYGFSIRCLAR